MHNLKVTDVKGLKTLRPSCFGEIQNCDTSTCIHSEDCQKKTVEEMSKQLMRL
jgi:hypothetical protein